MPLLAVSAAVPLALLIGFAHARFAAVPERAVMAAGAVLAAVLAIAGGALLVRYRRDRAALPVAAMTALSVGLVAIYLFAVSSAVFFPADILIWSENDFVNDVLKFRAGYPIYTADVNNESGFYSFGTQLLTYGIARAAGFPVSIGAYRVIQVLFTLTAAWVGVLCLRRITALMVPELRSRTLWFALAGPVLFLIATNPVTNAYTHALHNDALAQLLTVLAYYLLLRYAETRSPGVLAMMAVLPGLAFLSKQSVVIWGAFFGAYLLLARPFSLKRFIAYGAGAAAVLGAVLGACYALWGSLFFYWTFKVLGMHAVSPLRAFQHAIDIWPFLAAGLFGGWAMLRTGARRTLTLPWLIWLALILTETWTSGVAWMLNHIGPGCLIAGVWFVAGLMYVWRQLEVRPAVHAAEPALIAALIVMVLAGMGVVRVPLPMIPADAHRYVAEIEKQFEGLPRGSVLLDAGTWMYLPDGTLMKDRAPTIGERGYSQTGDFSGAIQRIREQRYSKILVRNYRSGDFWYDHEMWARPSGIRQALAENYEERGVIKAVSDSTGKGTPYLFTPVSILTPKTTERAAINK